MARTVVDSLAGSNIQRRQTPLKSIDSSTALQGS
jgi:hypothetical protein